MAETDHGLSRNPNVCASCSSMADGMGETTTRTEAPQTVLGLSSMTESVPLTPDVAREQVVIEWSSGRMQKRE